MAGLHYRLDWNVLDSYFQFQEVLSTPGTPEANNIRLYATDDGSGTTTLCYKNDAGATVCFPTSGTIVSGTGTSGQVAFWNGTSTLTGDTDLTFSVDTLSATKVAMSSLTSGRIPFASTVGLLVDNSTFTFTTGTNLVNVSRLTALNGITGLSLTATGLTSGSVVFAGTGGLLSQDNTKLFYDSTNHFLGIGLNASLVAPLHVKTAATLAARFDGSAAAAQVNIDYAQAGNNRWIHYLTASATPNFNFFNVRTGADVLRLLDSGVVQAVGVMDAGTGYRIANAAASGNILKGDGTNFVSAAGAALTKTDDTNVTLTLGGSPSAALIAATSLTLGWTGQLSIARGGTSLSAAGHLLNATLWDDVTAGTVSRGDVITGQGASAKWARLAKGTANQVLSMDGTATDVLWADAAAGSATTVGLVPGGRLTLTSATPVLTSTVTASTSIYYALYNHDRVPIYNGTSWTMTVFTELTNTTTDNTKNPAAVTTNSNYDLFVWSDSGTLRLGRGPAWTSDTARGTGAGTTELERINGVWMNKNAITNGPGADRGTYVGTVRSNGSSQIDWVANPAAASGGALCKLYVWNAYNRVLSSAINRDTDDQWTYSTATWRAANGSSAFRINFVAGLNEDVITSSYSTFVFVGDGSANARISINLDSTTAIGQFGNVAFTGAIAGGGAYMMQLPTYTGLPGIGFHFTAGLEYASGGTISNFGDAAAPANVQTGMILIGKF